MELTHCNFFSNTTLFDDVSDQSCMIMCAACALIAMHYYCDSDARIWEVKHHWLCSRVTYLTSLHKIGLLQLYGSGEIPQMQVNIYRSQYTAFAQAVYDSAAEASKKTLHLPVW